MSDELVPYVPVIEPTTVIGPDDWRPYSEPAPEPEQDPMFWDETSCTLTFNVGAPRATYGGKVVNPQDIARVSGAGA